MFSLLGKSSLNNTVNMLLCFFPVLFRDYFDFKEQFTSWKKWKSMGRIIPHMMENIDHDPNHQPGVNCSLFFSNKPPLITWGAKQLIHESPILCCMQCGIHRHAHVQNLPFGDDIYIYIYTYVTCMYHLFTEILGVAYYWVYQSKSN